ncbi:hypothetical protein MTR67_011990 [Solanum verrucosum]|uniref:Uncharacterized protein n=1 Tax=Solanum verrucosum TaxID=315347 RepID=A0AAF0QAH7_SOLVR|nr:hypothetical protein MTR67_011990 [Solanum verrucosum]
MWLPVIDKQRRYALTSYTSNISSDRGKNVEKEKGPAVQRPAEDSSGSMGIYDTHLTTLECDGEEVVYRRSGGQDGKPSSTPGTSTIVPSTYSIATTSTAAASRPPFTQAMLFKIGHLVQSSNVRALQVEVVVPGMIERAIVAALDPILADNEGKRARKGHYVTSHILKDQNNRFLESCRSQTTSATQGSWIRPQTVGLVHGWPAWEGSEGPGPRRDP